MTLQLYNFFDQFTINLINIPSILIQSINSYVITILGYILVDFSIFAGSFSLFE